MLAHRLQAKMCGAWQVLVGAESSELGADDLEELAGDEDEYFRLGGAGEQFRDYAALALKGDHGSRPATCQAL